MPRTREVAPEFYWFLAALGAHMLLSAMLFSVVFLVNEGALSRAAGHVFDVLNWPRPLPLASLLWAAGIALLAGLGRRVKGAV